MKIGIQTWGTHGDIRPFLALAEGLQKAGHDVTFVLTCIDSDRYKNYVSESGVKVKMIASPVFSSTKECTETIRFIATKRSPLIQYKLIVSKMLLPVEEQMYKAAEKLCRENDLLIGSYLHYPLRVAAKKYSKPWVSVILAHLILPASSYAAGGLFSLGKTLNLLSWKIMQAALNATIKRYPDKLAQKNALPRFGDFLNEIWLSPLLNLIAVSPALCPRQKEWPEHYKICGFFNMPNISLEGRLPGDFEDFISKDEPPIYMTLGSAMPIDLPAQKKTIELFIQAARLAKCRAIIQASLWQESGYGVMRGVYPDIFFVKETPHHLVFPRCKVIVHHGGAGTTQSATLAGVPSVIIAHISEQAFWARQLRVLGIAGRNLWRRSLSAARLAGAIKKTADSKAMKSRAKKAAEAMKGENGVEKAAEAVAGVIKTIKISG